MVSIASTFLMQLIEIKKITNKKLQKDLLQMLEEDIFKCYNNTLKRYKETSVNDVYKISALNDILDEFIAVIQGVHNFKKVSGFYD